MAEYTLANACLSAGRIMIENGSEMERAQDTMKRIVRSSGYKEDPQILAMITGLIISLPEEKQSQVESINSRVIDLEKVAAVNNYSRMYADKKITLEQLIQKLDILDKEIPSFPWWLLMVGACLVSGPSMVFFTGHIKDVFITSVIGTIGFAIFYFINKILNIKFISEFIASISIGFLAVSATRIHLGVSINDIIIGSIMPLVPGVLLTNAVRDVLNGHLVSGPARGVEGLLSAASIGFGIAFIFRFL